MWAQPWAWLGLIGLAVPVAIHLLARHQAVRTLFPSLRFIDASNILFIRRRRLTDIPLLLLRMAIVTAAVAALAGPRWSGRAGTTSGTAIAVVVDISAGAAGDEGRAAARAAVAAAPQSTIVESASLPAGIRAAVAWLERQSGRRELLVVSDFQRGSLDAAAVSTVPAGIGLRFQALPIFPVKLPPGFELRGDVSRMAWPASRPAASLPLSVLAGPDQPRAAAMLAAVTSLLDATPVDANARRATLVFPAAVERAALLSSAPAIDQPWMFDVVQPLVAEPSIRARLITRAAGGTLMLFVDDDPASTLAATIASMVLTSLVQPLAWSEFEPATIAPDQLRRWERAPAASPPPNAGEPQGRWLWLVVLLLIGAETWLRRRAGAAATKEAHGHAA